MRQFASLPQFKTSSLSAITDIYRDSRLCKAANNNSGGNISHTFNCPGDQLQQGETAEGGDFFNRGGEAHRLEPARERTSLTEFLTSLVWQTGWK